MAAKQSGKLCVYCRSPKDLTRDHIPPSSFFPKPRPTDLITVLCCRECHEEFTENDAYLRNYLIFSPQCRGHVAARQLQESGLRSLQDPNAGEFSNPLFNTGISLGPGIWSVLYHLITARLSLPTTERIEDVIERIIVGLFWIENDKYLPPDYTVEVVGSYDPRYMNWPVQQSVRRLQSEEEPVKYRRWRLSILVVVGRARAPQGSAQIRLDATLLRRDDIPVQSCQVPGEHESLTPKAIRLT